MEPTGTETIIAAEVEITGTVKAAGSIQFHGKLDGELISEADTTIGKGAEIKGNINAHSISIAGTIKGNISAKDRIQMLATAKVHGDIKAKRLTVEDGVTFIGRSEVNPTGEATSEPAPSYGASSGSVPPAGDSKVSTPFGKK
jgi:cytoskeletal protein CcmA (bactofilin family)